MVVLPYHSFPWLYTLDGKFLGLVVDAHCNLANRIAVLAGVVSAEQKLEASSQLDTEVGLRPAPVAPIGNGE